jgi:hypothetical protein
MLRTVQRESLMMAKMRRDKLLLEEVRRHPHVESQLPFVGDASLTRGRLTVRRARALRRVTAQVPHGGGAPSMTLAAPRPRLPAALGVFAAA